jgi:glycosyltransferase involved in cell wall biosynthesis
MEKSYSSRSLGNFDAGDYLSVASGSLDQWQTLASLGLLGRSKIALDGLRNFDQVEARFYRAVVHWLDGDNDAAIRLLEKIPTAHAKNLLMLIRKPKIHVLAHLPWWPKSDIFYMSSDSQDDKFIVQNIGFSPANIPNEPYADISNYYNRKQPPDFYFSYMIEWHLLPLNLQSLPCPILGLTSDFDLHIQTIYPWLKLFDEIVALGSTERSLISGLTHCPVSTYHKVYALADSFPKLSTDKREIDFFLSNTIIHPYHPDKAHLIYQILSIPGVHPLIVDGWLDPEDYLGNLSKSKVSCAYVRFPDSIPTRGIEALAMGCAVVIQRGSGLLLDVGEQEGVLTYDYSGQDLIPAVQRILESWPDYEKRAQRGAEIVRSEYSKKRITSRFLRFLTFLAARPRSPRQILATEDFHQKRLVVARGGVPGGPDVLEKLKDRNTVRWMARLYNRPSPTLILELSRQYVLDIYDHYPLTRLPDRTPLPKIPMVRVCLDLIKSGIEDYPNSLALYFAFIRIALHFGQPEDVSNGLQMAMDVLSRSEDAWQIDPMDDVFPWDFFSNFFNHRMYHDLIMEYYTRGTPVHSALKKLILASIHYYSGHYRNSLQHFRSASVLDPAFPFYQFYYARELIKGGFYDDYHQAGTLLMQVARNPLLCTIAFEQLEELRTHGLYDDPQYPELIRVVKHICNIQNSKNGVENWLTVPLQPAVVSIDTIMSESSQPLVIHVPNADALKEVDRSQDSVPLVSAIVSTYNAERFMRACLEDLENQTIRDQLEIIVIDSGSLQNEKAIVKEFQRKFSNIIYQRTVRENSHVAFNRAISLARGRYVTMANTDDRHHPDAFRRMVQVFETHPEVGLVYFDSAVTQTPNTTLERGPVIGRFRWPDFDRNLLFKVCYVGPQAMWRREMNEKYGGFDAQFYSAGDYELWLRLSDKTRFYHIPQVLGLYYESPTSNEHKDPGLSIRESEQARTRYWKAEDGPRPVVGGMFLERYTTVLDAAAAASFPLVSVIIPTYNRPGELRTALDSVTQQTYPNLEIILVNDAGEDVTQLVQEFSKKVKIRYEVHRQNQGAGAARNTGMRLAQGKYIAFLDDDDIYRPEHLFMLVAELEHSLGITAAYADGMQITVDSPRKKGRANEKKVVFSADFSEEELLVHNYIPMLTIVFRRSALEKAGYFDTSLPALEDWEWLIRLSHVGPFVHLPVVTSEYLVRQGGSRNWLQPEQIQVLYQGIYQSAQKWTSGETRQRQREFYARMTGRDLTGDLPELFAEAPGKAVAQIEPDAAPLAGSSVLGQAGETLELLLNADDLLAALEQHQDRLDADLLALVRENARGVRAEGDTQLAEGLDDLAEYIENRLKPGIRD